MLCRCDDRVLLLLPLAISAFSLDRGVYINFHTFRNDLIPVDGVMLTSKMKTAGDSLFCTHSRLFSVKTCNFSLITLNFVTSDNKHPISRAVYDRLFFFIFLSTKKIYYQNIIFNRLSTTSSAAFCDLRPNANRSASGKRQITTESENYQQRKIQVLCVECVWVAAC
jgi:hypothetical protein